MYQKKELSCKACKVTFFFTEKEQLFYAEKGFEDEPVRCPECRALKKKKRYRERQMYKIVCAECNTNTQVPFKPDEGRPVYCDDCHKKNKSSH